jgi:adenine-specific DNA methylase
VIGAGGINSLDGEAARKHISTLTDTDSPATIFIHTVIYSAAKVGMTASHRSGWSKQIPHSVNENGH